MNSSVQHKGPRNFYIVAARFETRSRAPRGDRPEAACPVRALAAASGRSAARRRRRRLEQVWKV